MNILMQHAGGMLLAAGLDGGNSFIRVLSRTRMQTNSSHTLQFTTTPYGVDDFLAERDLNISMQHAGGMLLAAGLDGGNSFIRVLSRTRMQTNSSHTLQFTTTPYGVDHFLAERDLNISMQHAGGMLLAAGLDGGNSFIRVLSRTRMQTYSSHSASEIRLGSYS